MSDDCVGTHPGDRPRLCFTLLIPMRFVWDADEEGEPIRPRIGWVDPRWTPDADECDGELAWPDRFPEDETAKL